MNRVLLAIAVIVAPLAALYAEPANAERPPVVRTVQSKAKAKESATKSKAPKGAYAWNGHKYMAVRNAVRWTEAKKLCADIGGHLVIIETAEEQDAIMTMLTRNGLGRDIFWIGATDEAQEGTWKWVDGSLVVYTNWAPREPNNHQRQEHYAELHAGFGGRWNDSKNHIPRWFICEWDE
jgi:hypothetical protein